MEWGMRKFEGRNKTSNNLLFLFSDFRIPTSHFALTHIKESRQLRFLKLAEQLEAKIWNLY
jgi:hypothetical protein